MKAISIRHRFEPSGLPGWTLAAMVPEQAAIVATYAPLARSPYAIFSAEAS